MKKITLGLTLLASIAIAGQAAARDQIRIVGSSTVYPFATTVAETFGARGIFKTPVVESTGSGGGLKLFCAGIGPRHPDITNASRRIKKSEIEKCAKAGISKITEVKIGFDGIVLANSKKSEKFKLSKKHIFMALAKKLPMDGTLVDNPYTKWSEIDPALPDTKIEVLGPPPTSGTRDAFVELAMESGARKFPQLAELRKKDKKAFKSVAHRIREDGHYIEAGENDNLIVQKLVANPKSLGIFGFGFLDQNADLIQGSPIGGIDPSFENIASGDYGISRSLYFYVKAAHVDIVPGIQEFLAEFTGEDAFGEFGYLTEKGLIPLSEDERVKVRDQAVSFAPLKMM